METLHLKAFSKYLKPRPKDFHKGDAGHVLIVGGAPGFSGAVCLAAMAALRIGAGLVSIATHTKHASFLTVFHPEIMCHSTNELKKLLSKATVVIVGPGLGQTAWAKKLLTQVLKSKKPLVVDADALNLLAKKPIKNNNWILTPHPGEAARLLQQTTQQIQRDRISAIKKLQRKYHGVCVLKGAGSLVIAKDGTLSICKAGNPAMATAGMGDVLSGVIAGLAAQGIPLDAAAKLGVLIHAQAGDRAAKKKQRGIIASDVLAAVNTIF